MMLDEPLASLDPLSRRKFLTALSTYVSEHGATVVLSSHIVTDIEQFADRILVLADGQVVLSTAVADAKAQFRTMPSGRVKAEQVVGEFSRPDGTQIALVRGREDGDTPTVEELVLGHLSATPR